MLRVRRMVWPPKYPRETFILTNFIDFTDGGDDRSSGQPYIWPLNDHTGPIDAYSLHDSEVTQISYTLIRFRNRARLAAHQYRRWKRAYETETDGFEKVYRAYDGIFIRRHFAEVWRLYLTVNRDYHQMRRI